MEYRNRSALITGASSGIGETFARELAARGMNLLLTALPAEQPRLEAIRDELRAHHGVRAEVVTADLAEREAPARLQADVDALAFEPDLLVNSAGLGAVGSFAELPLDRQLTIIQVNVEALVALTGLYLPRMVGRRSGAILNVASTSALDPIPYMAVYAASKAFVLRFSESLWAENRRNGIRVVAICPGPVATPFHVAAGDTEEATGIHRSLKQRYLTPESVVQAGLEALERDRPTVVRRLPGGAAAYALNRVASAVVPRRRYLALSEQIGRKLYGQS